MLYNKRFKSIQKKHMLNVVGENSLLGIIVCMHMNCLPDQHRVILNEVISYSTCITNKFMYIGILGGVIVNLQAMYNER